MKNQDVFYDITSVENAIGKVKYLQNNSKKVFINPYYAYNRAEDIEVKKKSDIMDYVEYLKLNGFKEVKSI